MNPRLPKNYQLILDTVSSVGEGTHLSLAEIFVRVRKRQPTIGFSTIHRGVTRLHELGVVAKIVIPGHDGAFYELARHQHAHLYCRHCGNVQDADFALARQTLASLARRHDFTVEGESITLTGQCAACS